VPHYAPKLDVPLEVEPRVFFTPPPDRGVRGFRDGAAGEVMFNHPNDVLPFGATGNLLVRKPPAHRLNAALT
jgi:hypothetical protein